MYMYTGTQGNLAQDNKTLLSCLGPLIETLNLAYSYRTLNIPGNFLKDMVHAVKYPFSKKKVCNSLIY